jgi:hypothetical protein
MQFVIFSFLNSRHGFVNISQINLIVGNILLLPVYESFNKEGLS